MIWCQHNGNLVRGPQQQPIFLRMETFSWKRTPRLQTPAGPQTENTNTVKTSLRAYIHGLGFEVSGSSVQQSYSLVPYTSKGNFGVGEYMIAMYFEPLV